MPYGLPAVIKLERDMPAFKALPNVFNEHDFIFLPAGFIIQPKIPLADQDGFNGEWLVAGLAGGEFWMLGNHLREAANL